MRLAEDAQKDLEARSQAREAFQRIGSHIESHGTRHMKKTSDGRFVLSLKKLNMGDVFVGFVDSGSRGGFKSLPQGWYIEIPVLLNPGDPSFLDTRWESVRRTFVHEFTHLLDALRFDIDKAKLRRYDHDLEAYFNSPHEVNAYFQEAVSEVEDMLESDDLQLVLKHGLKAGDFRSFSRQFLETFLDEGFRKHMREDVKRRILKRLFGFYEHRIVPLL